MLAISGEHATRLGEQRSLLIAPRDWGRGGFAQPERRHCMEAGCVTRRSFCAAPLCQRGGRARRRTPASPYAARICTVSSYPGGYDARNSIDWRDSLIRIVPCR
ncbi:hypothetical protein Mal4_11490 [Maioricimonas rarisocia]|uniref:Uncharacterized protein n=1 Tax=Maioricimonas rarisocia TaxID=2528026 RepID=A0A517Z2Y9_9PLAN|nr:hypothetical protein Mal4_11490 [Maioricimonas rarisocia]